MSVLIIIGSRGESSFFKFHQAGDCRDPAVRSVELAGTLLWKLLFDYCQQSLRGRLTNSVSGQEPVRQFDCSARLDLVFSTNN